MSSMACTHGPSWLYFFYFFFIFLLKQLHIHKECVLPVGMWIWMVSSIETNVEVDIIIIMEFLQLYWI